MKGLIKVSKIDREEIERVIDDFETKQKRQKGQEAIEAFDYCIARLRELL